jgi:hypothetical protein
MGKKITIYMLEDSGEGPKTIEIGNWSGKAIFSPRSTLKKLIQRDEFNRPGVYFLQGLPKTSEYVESIYIGEAEELRARLKQHLTGDKDFESVLAFISKDELLTKAHIRYLESRIITLAREAKTSYVENTNSPKLSWLSEADIDDMEYFLRQITLILPAVGIQALIPTVKHVLPRETIGQQDSPTYKIKSKNLIAWMREADDGFIVLKGSQCSKETAKSIGEGWIRLRKKLLENGVLIDRGEMYEFVDNAVFSSPSAAASVILGRQTAGPLYWITSEGKTYRQIQSEQLENTG